MMMGKTEDFFLISPKSINLQMYTELLLLWEKIWKIFRFLHYQRVFEQLLLFQFGSLWCNQGMKKRPTYF